MLHRADAQISKWRNPVEHDLNRTWGQHILFHSNDHFILQVQEFPKYIQEKENDSDEQFHTISSTMFWISPLEMKTFHVEQYAPY